MIIPPAVRRETDKLLAMYATYRTLGDKQAKISRKLAKAKLKGEGADNLDKSHRLIAQKMQSISDAMTFATPLIWALYKFEAYTNEAQPIRTMQDFRLHCSKPGYICTKRFVFVNRALNERHLPNLADTTAYPDNQSLAGAFEILWLLSQDNACMHEWESHEYYRVTTRVAKWED